MKEINLSNSIKVEKKDIDFLLKNYSIKDIETSLIKIFLEDNNFNTKNILLLNILKKNHSDIKDKIKSYLYGKDIRLDLKTIERFFELLIEPEDRKLNGAFYTPTFVVDYIVEQTINGDETVCDLSCGSGAFLIGATKRINKLTKKPMIKILEQNIFGADISDTSIYRSKILLTLFALLNGEDKEEIKFNIIDTDSLSYKWKVNYPNGFDVVIGNPPYVRAQNMPTESRKFINEKYFTASEGNIDLFIPFFELGLKILKETGRMGYISPNSYYTSRASKKLRDFLQQNGYIKRIIDFNHLNIFKGVTTYTCITILDKNKKDNFEYAIVHEKELLNDLYKLRFNLIKISKLNYNKWILLPPRDYDNIKKIENSGIPLGKLVKITNGIATLKDELFILTGKKEGNYYIKEFNGNNFKIEQKVTRPLIKASIMREENDILKNKLRVIFPYEKKGITYKPLLERLFKKKYPQCYKYFLEIKNKLSKRDRGKREYGEWYAYGRVQGYNIDGPKIITPAMSPGPRFVICNDSETLYYAGIGFFYKGKLNFLIKILNSKVFWYYVYKTSKEYKSKFWSLSKNFIENFTIPNFSEYEKELIIKKNQEEVNKFLIKKYDINI